MASLQGTTARLRRTFHYPHDSDSDSDSQPEAMDEQEQENFIQTLAAENAARNAQFARLLLLLPLLSTVAYVRPLLRPSTAMFALLGVTSLLATAFLLYRLPPTETGIAPLDVWASGRRSTTGATATAARASSIHRLGRVGVSRGGGSPLETYLPYLNLGLTALLILMGLVRGDERGGGFAWVSMGNLPGLVYSVSLTAKVIMAGVDPERDLSGLRYEYKGA